MRGQSLRNGVLMLVGALACVESLVVVLERQARPKSIDPAFYTEVQQAQSTANGRSFDVGHRPTIQGSALQPAAARAR
jgi:hypothetical protein